MSPCQAQLNSQRRLTPLVEVSLFCCKCFASAHLMPDRHSSKVERSRTVQTRTVSSKMAIGISGIIAVEL
jgi:hypothetical protein